MGNGVDVVLDMIEEALLLQIGEHALAGLEPVEAAIGFRRIFVDRRVGVENVDHVEVLPAADLEVVEVVGRRHLDRARALLRVGIVVGNDRQLAADQRQDRHLADQVLVALVVRVDGHAGVAQHGLRAGRGDDNVAPFFALDRISQVPHVALGFDLLDFQVGDGGQEVRIPVDQTLVPVDQAFLVKLHENLEDRPGQTFVHGEAFARPVARGAQTAQLIDDGSAGLTLPLPDPLHEGLPAHGVPIRFLVLHELALDDHLRGDAGMVHPRLPQHVLAAHAFEPDQNILDRVVEGVPHMQRAGYVGRRDDNAIGFRTGLLAALECAGGFPVFVDSLLDPLRIVGLIKHLNYSIRIRKWPSVISPMV